MSINSSLWTIHLESGKVCSEGCITWDFERPHKQSAPLFLLCFWLYELSVYGILRNPTNNLLPCFSSVSGYMSSLCMGFSETTQTKSATLFLLCFSLYELSVYGILRNHRNNPLPCFTSVSGYMSSVYGKNIPLWEVYRNCSFLHSPVSNVLYG